MPRLSIPFEAVDRSVDGSALAAVGEFALDSETRDDAAIAALDFGPYGHEYSNLEGANGSRVHIEPHRDAITIEVGSSASQIEALNDLMAGLEIERVAYRLELADGLYTRSFQPSEMGDKLTMADPATAMTVDMNVGEPKHTHQIEHAVPGWIELSESYGRFVASGRPHPLGPASMAWQEQGTSDATPMAARQGDDISPVPQPEENHPRAVEPRDLAPAVEHAAPANNGTGQWFGVGSADEWRAVLQRAAQIDHQAFAGVEIETIVGAIMANGGAAEGEMSVAQGRAVMRAGSELNAGQLELPGQAQADPIQIQPRAGRLNGPGL